MIFYRAQLYFYFSVYNINVKHIVELINNRLLYCCSTAYYYYFRLIGPAA